MGCTGHCLGCKKEMYGIDLCDECREKLDKYMDLDLQIIIDDLKKQIAALETKLEDVEYRLQLAEQEIEFNREELP